MTSISQAGIVIVDTSVMVNFAEAGALDVFEELMDWASTHQTIGRLLQRDPWCQPVELPDDLAVKVLDILGFVAGQEPQERLRDVGEVSSVVLAQHLRDSGGQQPVLLLDDITHGKNLAKVRSLEFVDTPGLIQEMVHCGAMSKPLGGKVWRAAFHRSKWAAYDAWIEESAGKR